jgi:hypothetical protein
MQHRRVRLSVASALAPTLAVPLAASLAPATAVGAPIGPQLPRGQSPRRRRTRRPSGTAAR